jgi:hypothetical protein
MTKEEFDIAHERLRSRTGWACVLVFFPSLAGFFAIGARYQDWFNHHDNLTLLAFGVWIGGFLTAMYFISRWLHKRSGLVCPTCGSKEFPPAPNGQCWNCNGLPKVTRKYWPVTVIIGLAGGAVGTIASRNPVRFGVLWLAGFVLVCVGVWWMRRQESKREHPEFVTHSERTERPLSFSWLSLFIVVPLLIAAGFGLVDTIGRPHAVRNGLLWLAALVVVSIGGAWMRRNDRV